MADLRQYEVLFIVDPGADDDEVAKITDGFKQIITDQGGNITKAETLGRRQLAYEILRKKEGTFVDIELEGSGREIAELERRMRVNDRVLRYLTVRMDEDRQRALQPLGAELDQVDGGEQHRGERSVRQPPQHTARDRDPLTHRTPLSQALTYQATSPD